MKFKIHFEVGDFLDFFVVEGETIEKIKEIAKKETESRGLDEQKNNLWSEEL
jgi:hypothetical protein